MATKLPCTGKRFRVELHLKQDIKALIVEDEIDICFLLTGILRKRNLNTTFVNTLQDAKNILAKQHPMVLFLDNNLPDGLGVNIIQEIKNTHPTLRIIVITADDTLANKATAIKAGADLFLGKPFTRDAINKAIDAVMEKVH